MKKVEAVIIEDQTTSANLLKHFIKSHSSTIKIVGEANNVEEGINLIRLKKPELIFLDVVLENNYCFSLLENIKVDQYKIVFITAHEKYAVRAFKYNALDYLLKPFSIEDIGRLDRKIFNAMDVENIHLKNQIYNLIEDFSKTSKNNNHDYITISSLKKIEFIKYRDLMYLESNGGYTLFYLSSGKQIVGGMNLGQYEKYICNNSFYRIHKSYIVNLNFIKIIDKSNGTTCIMHNGKYLPIGRRRVDNLMQFLKS